MPSLREMRRGTAKDRFVDTPLCRFRIFTVPFEDYDARKDPDWPDEGPWEFEPDHPDAAEYWSGSELYHTHGEARRACLAWVESRFDRDRVIAEVDGQVELINGIEFEIIC
jgi:hypothetical protein